MTTTDAATSTTSPATTASAPESVPENPNTDATTAAATSTSASTAAATTTARPRPRPRRRRPQRSRRQPRRRRRARPRATSNRTRPADDDGPAPPHRHHDGSAASCRDLGAERPARPVDVSARSGVDNRAPSVNGFPDQIELIAHGNWLCQAVNGQPRIPPLLAPFPVTYVWYVIDISSRPGQAGIGVWSIVKELNPTANDWQLARMTGDMVVRNEISYKY